MKGLTIIGVIMILIGIGVFYSNSLGFERSLANSTIQYSLASAPHSTQNVSFTLSGNSTVLLISYTTENSVPVTFYLMNQSAFMTASSSSNSLLNESQILEGAGVYAIINDSPVGLFPFANPSTLAPPNYEYNRSGLLNNGTYYSVFQNPTNLNTTIQYATVKKIQFSADNQFLQATVVYDGTGGLLFLLGIAIIGYSVLVKKDAKKEEEASNENIEELYAKYSQKPQQRSASKSKRKKMKSK